MKAIIAVLVIAATIVIAASRETADAPIGGFDLNNHAVIYNN